MDSKSTDLLVKFLIIATALVLLLAIVCTTLLVIAKNRSEPSGNDDTSDDVQGAFAPSSSENSDTQNKVSGAPLYPTKPSRTNYMSKSAADVAQVGSAIKSNNAILVELGTYTSVAEKNADEKIFPASMTKVMTLLVACERVTDLDKKLVVTQAHIDYKSKTGGSGDIPFAVGEGVRVRDLLQIIIHDSDTIACLLIAEYIAGSEAEYAALMNKKAEDIGLKNTHFSSVTGLHDNENYTTCRDMAAIMAYALENELVKEIMTYYKGYKFSAYIGDSNTVKYEYPTSWSDWYSTRLSDNAYVKNSGGKTVAEIMAGKTGWEEIPRACFVTYAIDNNGKGYICVVVGRSATSQPNVLSTDSTADTRYLYRNYVS